MTRTVVIRAEDAQPARLPPFERRELGKPTYRWVRRSRKDGATRYSLYVRADGQTLWTGWYDVQDGTVHATEPVQAGGDGEAETRKAIKRAAVAALREIRRRLAE